MKLFCSYAFTDQDPDALSKRMRLVVDTLNKAGHDAYCPLFDPHKIKLQAENNTKAIFDYAFRQLSDCDGMVAIVASANKSEGQLMEIGANLAAKKPLFLFIHSSFADKPTHLIKLATKTFYWENEDNLRSHTSNIQP